MSTDQPKRPAVTIPAILKALDELDDGDRGDGVAREPLPGSQPTLRTSALIRPDTFTGRRAGETHAFTKQRKKNRSRNKVARASRKR